jgi:hypothetical protein
MNDDLRNAIKTLVRAYYDYQNERLALDGRLEQKKDGSKKKNAQPTADPLLLVMYKRREDVYALEQHLEKEIATEVHKHALWKSYLCNVKGVGETIAAVIISEIEIEKAPHPSNLWSFAGLAPGKDRKQKGQKCPFNQFLRAKLNGVLGGSFLKSNSPYREFYDNVKHRLENSDDIIREIAKGGNVREVKWKDATPGHRHKAAIRYMVKMFLRDLYVAWRTLEGLPVSEPYQEQYLGHNHAANHPEKKSA